MAIWSEIFQGERGKDFRKQKAYAHNIASLSLGMKSFDPPPGAGLNADSKDPQRPTTVAIVDDDENDRRLMVQAVKGSGQFVCVGAYGSAIEALAEIPKVRPQVVLMDIRMPGMSGIECARRLRNFLPELVVIFISGLVDDKTLKEAEQTRPDDYLVKPLVAGQCIARMIIAVGRKCRDNSRGKTGSARGLPQLTERERAVLFGLAKGLLYKEIAEELHITEAIMHKLQHSLFSKLQVTNRSEAIAIYFKQGR